MYLVLLVEIKQCGGRLWVCKVSKTCEYYGGVDLVEFHVIVKKVQIFYSLWQLNIIDNK
jgi:hypothetical protein